MGSSGDNMGGMAGNANDHDGSISKATAQAASQIVHEVEDKFHKGFVHALKTAALVGLSITPIGEEAIASRVAEEGVTLAESTAQSIKRVQLAENVKKGKWAEETAKNDLEDEGYNVVASQVHVQTRYGNRVIDHLVKKDGSYTAVEVKAGQARYRTSQRIKDNEIAGGQGTFQGLYRMPEDIQDNPNMKINTVVRRY